MSKSAIDIQGEIAEIINNFKAGKDISNELVDIRSGGNYFEFHQWVISRALCNNFYFFKNIENIPLPEGDDDCVEEYFSEEQLNAKLPEEKIANLSLDSRVDMDNDSTFHYEIIDGVCVSVESYMEGKNGPHFYDLKISKDLDEAVYDFGKEAMIIDGKECLNYTRDELVEFWDCFVLRLNR